MRHIVLILAHRNLDQLFRLVNKLSVEFDCLIHIDKKTDISTKDLDSLSIIPNVYLCKNRISISRANYSLIEVVKLLIKESIDIQIQYDKSYSYFILISGMDYPLKSPRDLSEILDSNYPNPILDVDPLIKSNMVKNIFKRYRFVKFHSESPFKPIQFSVLWHIIMSPLYFVEFIYTILNKKPSSIIKEMNINALTGNAWWIFTEKDLLRIFFKVEFNKKLLKMYKYILAPEEHFFQTLYFHDNSQIDLKEYINNQKILQTFVLFTHPIKEHVSPDGHPYVFLSDDFDLLKASNALFARKFDDTIDSKILDKLDEYHNE